MRWLVEKALAAPFMVVACAAGLLGVGIWSYTRMDIEAYPNPVAPMIEVITQPAGWSAEEVERYVTIPLENGLAGMIDLEHIRSQSLFGLSDVKCYFDWTPDYQVAQQRVINRLQFIQLPPGIQPQLSPWSAIGEIYRYSLKGRGYSLAELKTAQDFILERQFRQVPGVVDVVGFGGETKEFHVDVDPYRLRGHALTLGQLTQALANANQNVGGQRLSLGEQSFNVRGLGLIRSLDDIGQIVLAQFLGRLAIGEQNLRALVHEPARHAGPAAEAPHSHDGAALGSNFGEHWQECIGFNVYRRAPMLRAHKNVQPALQWCQ